MNPQTDTALKVALAYAAGNTTREGAIVDMAGFGSIRAIATFGAIDSSAVTSIKWQAGDDDGLTDAADLKNTAVDVADDDDDKLFVDDLAFGGGHRYVRVVVVKDETNDSAESVLYELYNPIDQPVSGDEGGYVRDVAPEEGTA